MRAFSAFGEIQSFGTGDVPERPGEESRVERSFREFSSLGEILPPIAGTALNAADAAQYPALASGKAVGGNFQHFKDAADKGWVPDSAAGYALYLAYNTLGQTDARFAALPEYVGWNQAAVGAYAVVVGQKQGNAFSAAWTPDKWTKQAVMAIRGLAAYHKWTPAQEAVALQAFADNFPRLLTKWGYTGPAAAPVDTSGERIMNTITGQWLYKGTHYSRYTTDQYGNITIFDLNGKQGVTFGTGPGGIDPGEQARAAAATDATYKPGIGIMVAYSSPPSPGDGINFAVLAWRTLRVGPNGTKDFGPWQKGSGYVHRTNDPQVIITSIEDARYDLTSTNGAAYWDNISLQKALTASGTGSPVPGLAQGNVSDPTKIFAPVPSGTTPPPPPPPTALPPGATVNPWTDVAVPPPPAPVPVPSPRPQLTVTGGGSSSGGIVDFAEDSLNDSTAKPVAPSVPKAKALGYTELALAAAAVWFFTRNKRR